MHRIELLVALGSSVLLGACAATTVIVTPSGQGLVLEPRKADCVVEFYSARKPDHRFDEIATLALRSTDSSLSPWEAQEQMRRRACALGADAVIVLQSYVGIPLSGSAVSYPALRADPAARFARDARGIVDLMPPPGFSLATVRVATPILHGPGDSMHTGEFAAGTVIWAVQSSVDACQTRHPDGREGWVDCGALVFGAPQREEKSPASGPSPTSTSI